MRFSVTISKKYKLIARASYDKPEDVSKELFTLEIVTALRRDIDHFNPRFYQNEHNSEMFSRLVDKARDLILDNFDESKNVFKDVLIQNGTLSVTGSALTRFRSPSDEFTMSFSVYDPTVPLQAPVKV